MKRILSLVLCALMLAAVCPVSLAAESDEIFTVYVGDVGNDETNDGLSPETPVATLAKAFELIGTDKEAVIKIVGTYNHDDPHGDPTGRKHVTLAGHDESSLLIYTKTWGLGGDTTIENINWQVNANSIYILAFGNTIEFGKGVVTTRGANVGCDISIRGGADTRPVEGNTNIILRSGTFFHIVGGTANRDVNGNTNITIYGGIFTNAIDGGNNSYIANSPGEIKGNTNIKIYGGDFTACKRVTGSDGSDKAKVLGTKTLDISEFDGEFPLEITKYFDKIIEQKEEKDFEIIEGAKYITGYADKTFKPQGNIKRCEAAAVVTRLVADENEIKGKYTTTYSDVEQDKWYASQVSFLETEGFIEFFEGEFQPEKNITRAEFVAMLAKLGEKTHKPVSFSDVTEDHPLYTQIIWAASNNVVNGYPDGTFRPDATITRAEAVTAINRYIGRNEVTEGESSFSDAIAHWAKGQIEAAAFPEKAKVSAGVKEEMDKLSTAAEYIAYAKGVTATDKAIEAVNYGAQKLEEAIKQTKSEYVLGEGGTTYYVSPEGDDANDGKSPEKAWKTIGRVSREDGTLKAGDVVLFERGGEWRGQKLWTKPGVTYSAYGEGAKPVFNRSTENGAAPEKWTLVEGTENIYKYNGNIMDCGTIIFNGGEKHAVKHIPMYRDGKYLVRDTSTVFDPKTQLTKNLNFVQLDYTKVGTVPSVSETNCYGTIYLRCNEGNPGEVFESIEFSSRDHAIVAMKNVTIDNIRIINAGAHGISAGNCIGLTVRNCEFEFIGGGIQGYTNGYPVRYGNAVEIWGSSSVYKVYNNSFNNVYDAAITNQYKIGTETANNIAFVDSHFHGNVIRNTKYPIEIFLRNGTDTNEYAIENMVIENNIIIDLGYGLPAQVTDGTTAAAIKSVGTENPSKGYYVRNNIFMNSNRNLFEANALKEEWLPEFESNMYIQKEDALLGTWFGKQYNFDANAVKNLAEIVGDTDAIVIYTK